jgi:formyltetrahydrofolate-dependent phosphoribosylglycinamide formyltransferase
MTDALKEAHVDLVCNAGFMRLHSSAFVRAWSGRQLNIHPSLLPSFRGLRPQARALEAGVRVSGATVHFVSEEMDAGPIIAQGAVPVLAGDTEEALSERILAMEHRLYPLALKLVASGAARLENGHVEFASADLSPSLWPQM